MRKFILLLTIVLGLCNKINAQNLLISTDYGNCGMGLKDSSGNWVLAPHYDNIKRNNWFYIVEQGGRTGLVNRYGEIVIPVIYDNIETEEVKDDFVSEEGFHYRKAIAIYYRVTKNEKFGLLDTTNKIIVPLEYDFLKINDDNTFLVRRGKKNWGVFHADGTYSDLHYHHKRSPGYKGCGLYSVSRPSLKKFRHPFRYSSSGHYKFGLIDEHGKVILKKKYTRIGYLEKNSDIIITRYKKKTIYYRQNGTELFRFDNNSSNMNYSEFGSYGTLSNSINRNGYDFGKLNNKYGIISNTGDTILPFVYEYMNETYLTAENKSQYIIRVRKDTLYGYFDAKKRQWILQPEYESVYVVNSYYKAADSSLVSLFRVEKNGKYGIISSAGEVIIPFSITGWSRNSNEFFMLIDSIPYQFSMPGYNNSVSTTGKKSNESRAVVTKIPASGKFSQVKLKDGTLLYINPDLKNDSAQQIYYRKYNSQNPLDSLMHITAFLLKKVEKSQTISPETKYYQLNSFVFTRDSIFPEAEYITQKFKNDDKVYIRQVYESWQDKNYTYYKCGSEYIRSDGFSVLKNYKFLSGRKALIDSTGNFRIEVNTPSYKWGLVDNNGKLLIDTAWNDIEYLGDNYYSVKKWEHYKRRKKYPDQYHYYNVVDGETGKVLLPEGYHSSYIALTGYHSAMVTRNGSGVGIYNFDQGKYSLPPVYGRIDKLDSTGKYYIVKTCSGKIGIVSWDGQWLADTSWTAMINASYDRKYADQYSKQYSNKIRQTVVLSDKGKWLIVNTANGTVSSGKAERDSILSKTFSNYKTVEIQTINYNTVTWQRRCWNCPTVDSSKSKTDFRSLSEWQREILFDSLFAYQTFYYDTTYIRYSTVGGCHCPNQGKNGITELYSFQKEYASSTLKHKISFANENCISVTRTGGFQQKHFTVIQYADGPHSMLLDSLFTGTQWKSFLITEIMAYLNSHPGINGNCSNPAALPFILKNNFEIKSGGINLYMAGYYEKGMSLEILIPWEKLKPYLRADVMEKIGVK